MSFGNPFAEPSGIFETRPRSLSTTEREAELARRKQERVQETKREHLTTSLDLVDYLREHRRHDRLSGTDEEPSLRDPWSYEPLLSHDLLEARAHGDLEQLHHLRALLQAGERGHEGHARLTQSEALARLEDIRKLQRDYWQARIRHADPATSREHRSDLDEQQQELLAIAQAIRDAKIGPDLEPQVRALENIELFAWGKLRAIASMHGIEWKNITSDFSARPLVREIDLLRPVRNLLYYRRLYPELAQQALRA